MSAALVAHRELPDGDEARRIMFRFIDSALDMGHFVSFTTTEKKAVDDNVRRFLVLSVFTSDPTLAEIIELHPAGGAQS